MREKKKGEYGRKRLKKVEEEVSKGRRPEANGLVVEMGIRAKIKKKKEGNWKAKGKILRVSEGRPREESWDLGDCKKVRRQAGPSKGIGVKEDLR